jgi:hypothetical protein
MADALQMPAAGYVAAEEQLEREESYRQQLEGQRLQDRIAARQQPSQTSNLPITKQETDEVIRLFRLITALNPLTFIWWIIETTLRYITANLMGFEWPGIWQKVSKVERWVMFGADALLFFAVGIGLALLLMLNPAVLTQFALDNVFGFLKSIGCNFFKCS